jgi:hypothetical protein
LIIIVLAVACFWSYQYQLRQQKEAEAAAQSDAQPAEDSKATPMQDYGQLNYGQNDSSAAPVPVVVGQVVSTVPGEVEQNAVLTDAELQRLQEVGSKH